MARDDFAPLVVAALGKRASFICSNPGCRRQTIAPSSADAMKFLYIGAAAHITAASKYGPRYDPNMTTEDRAAITNGIFLCRSCADLIDKNKGIDFTVDELRSWKSDHEDWVSANLNKTPGGVGGDGGGGTIIGNRGTVIGGKGGEGGTGGSGGKGGSGFIQGDDGLIIGGNGGSAGTADGRGGKGARSPMQRVGSPTDFWGYGNGASGANHPEYDRRLTLLAQFRHEYLTKLPEHAPYVHAGIDIVPCDWINQRLAECSEQWRVEMGEFGYTLPPLTLRDRDDLQ